MFKRFTLLLVTAILGLALHAQIPAGYYDAAAGKTGDILRAALRDITTSGHVKLPYTSSSFDVWDAYAVTDVRPSPNNTIIWDMYSDIPSGSPAYTFTIFTDQCGTAAVEGDCYSREHCMPNSWWGGLDNPSNPQYTDLHHLFPSDQYVNNRKSNYIVAETNAPTWTSTNGSELGPCSLAGFTGTVFEPINEYKGDFARAFFYLATRYMNNLSTWRNTYSSYDSKYIIATTGGNYLQWYIDMLVRWHNQDPVSQKEIDRNNNIYYNTPQANRNPYIDHPEYVCQVWTSSYCASVPVIINIINTPVYPNAANTVAVTADITDNGSITSATLQWCTDGSSFGNSITMTLNGAPNYITSTAIPAQSAGTTVTYRIIAIDNDGNPTTSAINSYTVLKNEPSNHPTGFGCGTTTGSSISLTWTDATGSVLPDAYLIKASSVGFASIADPVDGTAEADGSFVKNVTQGTQTVSFSGLSGSTTYYFKIYPYTNSLSNINYKTAATIQTSTCITSAVGSGSGCATDLIISEYVEGTGSNKYIELYNNTGAAVNLNNYKLRLFANGGTTAVQDITLSGTLNDQSTIVYKNASATAYTGTATVCDATNYNGNDAVALYKISTSSYVDIFGRIGENPGTAWTSGSFTTLDKTLVRNSNITSGVTVNPASGFPTLATEWTQNNVDVVSFLGSHTMACGSSCSSPTIQSSVINFTAVSQTSLTINWTNGDGTSRIVVMKQGSAITGSPIAGTTYVANSAFGSGSTLNTGEYVVYNNSGSSVPITNLTAGLTYYIAIFEYNCTAGSQLYLTPAAAANVITYSLVTGATPDNQYCLTTSIGFTTSIDFTSTGTFTANTYTAQLSNATGSFSSPVSIGTLISNANSGTINCTLPANTPSGTGYLIRVVSNGPALTGSVSNTFEIVLYAPCIAPASASSSRNNFCVDDAGTIDLSVTGGSGSILAWYSGSCTGTLVGTGNPLTIPSPSVTTTYYAKWENACSNSSCASVTVTPLSYVTASVSIAASPSGAICSGTSVTFTPTPVNGGTPGYQWKVNGSNVGTGATYTSSTLANADVVTCVMTSNASCATGSPATSNAINMSVNSSLPASVSIAAAPAGAICPGTSVTFTPTPVNGGTPGYQWKVNGSNVGTGATYTSSTLANADVVTCVMTSNASCATGSPATSNAINMSVNSSLPASVSIAASPSGAICSGTSVTFTPTPVNGGTPNYQWNVNGSNVGTGATYTSSTLANADVVTCVMTSNASCATGSPATSNELILTVYENPTLNLGLDVNACSDQSIVLEAGAGFSSYLWQDGSTNQTLVVDSAMNGLGSSIYYALVENAQGCQASDTIVVTLSLCVGIHEDGEETAFLFWPNPVHEFLQVFINGGRQEQGYIQLTDMSGRNILLKEVSICAGEQLVTLNLGGFPSGIYQLRLLTNDGIYRQKIVIN